MAGRGVWKSSLKLRTFSLNSISIMLMTLSENGRTGKDKRGGYFYTHWGLG